MSIRPSSLLLIRHVTPSPREEQDKDQQLPQRKRQRLFHPLESAIDDERRPRRLESSSAVQQQQQSQQQNQLQSHPTHAWNDWGVHQHLQKPYNRPIFPDTVDACTDAAWEAIAATLYNKSKMDPNVVQNVLRGDTVHGRRPVRGPKDAGRIGIEIDGASCLFRNMNMNSRSDSGMGMVRETDTATMTTLQAIHSNKINASAIRRVSLVLAGKLSQGPWKGYEKPSKDKDSPLQGRQVAVYFNTIKQALAASQELQLLKRIEQEAKNHDDSSGTSYDNVQVLCLGENDGVPKGMNDKSGRDGKKTMAASLTNGVIDPTKGLLLVVQPTDYNAEYRPPGPSVGTVEAFQRLVASAAIAKVPTVVLSPRFLANEIPYSGSWEQSGYQQSAIYGGLEPPRGPTPWVMRDFSPPVFSWVGRALSLGRTSDEFRNVKGDACRYSGVSLMQSVMHQGHSWHLFASQECQKEQQDSQEWSGSTATSTEIIREPTNYQYLASTKSASGRPTRNVLRRVFGEFAPYD